MRYDDLELLVRSCLDTFYERRLQKLTDLNLKDVLKRKNPYLFRATGAQKASEIVERLLQAHMSSSEESIFGDSFFEPIVRTAARGRMSEGEGLDVVIETSDSYTVISVKSGPNWGNSGQKRDLQTNFNRARNVFATRHVNMVFRALLGQCYGNTSSEPKDNRTYSTRSGQAFWEELTGDPNFYLDLVRAMGDHPIVQREAYDQAWNKAVNRFEREFLVDFSFEDGNINWERLVQFNSGKKPTQPAKTADDAKPKKK